MKLNITREELHIRGGVLDEMAENAFDAAAILDEHCRVLFTSTKLAKFWNMTHLKPLDLPPVPDSSLLLFKKVIEEGKGNYNLPIVVNGYNCLSMQIPLLDGDEVIGILATLKHLDYTQLKEFLINHEHAGDKEFEAVYDTIAKAHTNFTFDDFIGNNPRIKTMLNFCKQASKTHYPILFVGETGTGKELLSHAIHSATRKSSTAPFIRINCTAIPKELLESELFGHEKGAFTGAYNRKIGKFERAAGGTILLDEIGDMDLSLQGKLLRVLESKEFERVGGNRLLPLKARIIAATNKDLHDAYSNGTFRKDLYFRLNTFEVRIPPLRERPEDIPLLVEHILNQENFHITFTPEAMELLCQYDWPGNIRQLKNLLIRLSVIFDSNTITWDVLKEFAPDYYKAQLLNPASSLSDEHQTSTASLPVAGIPQAQIIDALDRNNHNISAVARILNVSRPTLYKYIRKYGIKVLKNQQN